MVEQYRAWLLPDGGMDDAEREAFFTDGLVVLDTNILLSLYEYNPGAREQVFAALEQIADRLWLPHQVGLEFVRGRHRVIVDRLKALKDAPAEVDRKLQQARQAVIEASDLVKRLLAKYAQDDVASAELDEQINPEAIDGRLDEYRTLLRRHVQHLKDEQDLLLGSISSDDPILPRVAALFLDRIAAPTPPDTVRQRLDEALTYRFPNQIPPGFSDGRKGTSLEAAGDFLLWAEIVEKARGLEQPCRVLLVSSDGKGDWYEKAEPGRSRRPWPMLFDELRLRAGAELRLEEPRKFFEGIKQFLNPDVELAATTYEEIDRAAAVAAGGTGQPDLVTEGNAAVIVPADGLALDAYRAAGLTTGSVRRLAESPMHRQFQWWLIGATAQLGQRNVREGEPQVEVLAAVRSERPPGPEWLGGDVLTQGEWPYRGGSWIAPWFVQVVRSASEADRLPLQRLAARHADRVVPGG
ncbi:PIN-like domain-containing protein [Kitasatospora azatica]|uniref:PIN-like domain-containing protein n=1 Tax=Kitasatospora azatica TaxID=58347 RepID=UPI00055E2EA9|nr:PIN-like domain-containing protein [Kitasatospora azatica]